MYECKLKVPLKLPIQFFAGAAEEEDPKQNPEDQQQENPEKPGADDGLPKTQEELNALIEKRLARERRKMAKQQNAQAPAQKPADPQDAPAAPAADTSAMDALNRQLLIANAQLTAMREGVNPAYAEDAVLLAVMQAEKEGEADAEGVQDALKEVLKRHPEWKQSAKKEQGSGFKVGVDAKDGAGAPNKKPGLPSGRVIF